MSEPQADAQKLVSLLFVIGRRIRNGANGSARRPQAHLRFEVLQYIKNNRGALMHEVARYLCVTPSAATFLVEGLVKEGFLSRRVDRKDRRVIHITITATGNQFIARMIKEKMTKMKKMFAVLRPAERAQLLLILQKIAKQV